jgi:serine/threonine protein kinase
MATMDFAPASPPKPPSSSSSPRTSSSAEYLLHEGRFLPGRLLAGRYRIISLLGKGGMGEVYRADDLTLGQSVALKFLPDDAARDENLLERFRNEVRMARRVSHPNVCRVYDVGDVDGHTFFTMEYVDGEDLASLLRRIGRLPADKALDIARHLCAGLAAAHAKGVLHRDLKPANIMLDGRGQVVITDFGLAGVAEEIRGPEVRSGTPAYMAPEQLDGKEVSTRSDVFSLGLVLYEVFTGKRAFGEAPAGSRRGGDHTPSRPSSVVRDLDPIVEKVILRCLETEPTARPATALAVAAALPGGDPLAAALAAGETPSPQMVAAAGETVGLRPRIAVACLLVVLVCLAINAYLTIRYSGTERLHLDQSPEVLEAKAREIISRVGYPEKPADSVYGIDYDNDFSDYAEQNKKDKSWDDILAERPSIFQFWYRQSPQAIVAQGYRDTMVVPGIPDQSDPPSTFSGMINVELDHKGRLTKFSEVPPQKFDMPAQTSAPDWSVLFAAAEIDPATLYPAQPQWNPLAAADARAAWTGAWPGTNFPLRVEAAAWHGKPVYFALLGDWSKAKHMVAPSTSDEKKSKVGQMIGFSLLIFLLVVAALIARKNYLHGRGDREGALRLAGVLFVLQMLMWLCRSHMVAGFETLGLMMLAIASGLLIGGIVWMLYLAIEPWIRRRWPHAIISWSRLISGQLRDPLVGRDILFGVAFGAVWILIFAFVNVPMAKLGASPSFNSSAYLLGGRLALGQWLKQIPNSILGTLQFFFVAAGLRWIFRKDWIAAIPFVLLFTGMQYLQNSAHAAVFVSAYGLVFIILVIIVFRFGLVPLAVAAFTVDMLANVPLTADFSEWYMGTTVLALLSVVALAGWGFYHSLGGGSVWKVEME